MAQLKQELSKYHVMVVDDSDFFVDMTAGILGDEHGLQTTPAYGFNDAIEKFREDHFDCVISDYDMPEGNGLELYEEIRKESDVPFILLTGRGDEKVASQAIGAGVSDYLRKLEVVENQRYELLANRVRNLVSQYETRRDYALLLENTPDEISQVSLDGTVLAVNDAVADALEMEPEDVVNRNLINLLPEEVAERRLEEGKRAVSSGERQTLEDSYDGRFYHNILVPVGRQSNAEEHNAFQIISRDITEQKEREQQIHQMNEELELINRIVRHDIRNDMNVVTGWGEILETQVDEEGEVYLDRMLETSRHVIELTDNTKDFVETLTGHGDVDLKDMDLCQALENEVEKARTTNDEVYIRFTGCPEDIKVVANELLSSIFRNLVTNASQHNDSDDPELEISVEEGEERVTVSFADNGPGVPEEQRDEIFGKGEKGLESSGSGVGLYLVHTLAESYGGEAWVEENEPRGSVFKVELRKA